MNLYHNPSAPLIPLYAYSPVGENRHECGETGLFST